MQIKVGDIASLVEATVEGDADAPVRGVAGIAEANPGDVTFCSQPKFLPLVLRSKASAILVPLDYRGDSPAALLRVADPYRSFLQVIRLVHPECPPRPRGIHPTAVVDTTVSLGKDVSVGPLCVVEERAELGDGVTLAPGVHVGAKTRIGEGSYLYPRVTVREDVRLGRNVIVHSGAVLGSDGFGYLSRNGAHEKVPQIGSLVVEDDVEIGANVTIDRGTLGETRIGKGVKIDNLVHIAHNVTIGEHSLVVAQVGISGSTQLGHHVTLGGQSGVAGHITVGEGAMIGAQAGVTKSVPPGSRVSGYPAMEHDRARRLNAYYRRLPNLFEQIRRLEERVRELEGVREREEVL